MSLSKDDLLLTKNAIFYKNTRTTDTNKIIEKLINKASNNKNEDDFILDEINKEYKIEGSSHKYSIRIFKTNKPVYFIKNKELFDIVFAYILILEIDNHIVIFSKNTTSISKELKEEFELVKHIDFANTLNNDAEYQKLTLRNITISNQDIRTRSYEASNLNGLLSLYSASRSIPSHLKVKEKERKVSLSNTGRIIENAERINIEKLIIWTASQIKLLQSTNNTNNAFMSNFAKNIELSEILKSNNPNAVLLEHHLIYDYIVSIQTPIYRKTRKRGFQEIHNKLEERIFNKMEKIYELDDKFVNYQYGINRLITNKNGFSIKSPLLRKFYIKENNEYISLQRVINRKKLFSVTFNNPSYMYFMGSCFQDNTHYSEINNILSIVEIFPEMQSIKSEKGKITAKSKNFQINSLFQLVEKIHKKRKDKYIFCDDLGDEWADHITINMKENSISFIHSKYKEVSNSASNLQDVTGQAIKNLGNMQFSKEKFLKKLQNLNKTHSSSNIARIRKGNINDLATDLDILLKQHSLHRKCIIACSFLSKKEMETEFQKLTSGQKVRGNIIQLLWILSSFIHAAKESGIIPVIYCQP